MSSRRPTSRSYAYTCVRVLLRCGLGKYSVTVVNGLHTVHLMTFDSSRVVERTSNRSGIVVVIGA